MRARIRQSTRIRIIQPDGGGATSPSVEVDGDIGLMEQCLVCLLSMSCVCADGMRNA
jgi:hypothetical protein